ncbi:MAG: S-adenosylmethionine synthase [Candidatus Saccharibacteria bacterium GW2011_GWC2_48_9]|nr:MAG: S-adenosylmethionine synthase [Candidatus Saccharibacteria bacterium GW2011_GWC2_48_9]HCH34283.1 methionine adenosyltransferase [Candidatus Saccharibacteria bacterium]
MSKSFVHLFFDLFRADRKGIFMSVTTNFRTAESVSPKHPDKLCDQISDAILDAHLQVDPLARVAVDVAGGHGTVFVTGEVTSQEHIDVEAIVRRIAGDIEVIDRLAPQSSEIAQGVDTGGAGDQGIMIGYATNETPEYIPLETALSRSLNQYLYERWPHDGKTQVTVQGDGLHSIVASFQHAQHGELAEAVKQWARTQTYVAQCFIGGSNGGDPALHINPAGDWNVGGFDADAGLTGRKLAVDNYGPRVPLGGGAFSGKDPSKVDRSGAYMARRIAVDYLEKRHAKEVFVRLAYAIGYDQPLEQTVNIDGVQEEITGYDLSPNGIISTLNLRRPIYEDTAKYGHFGHSFSWD